MERLKSIKDCLIAQVSGQMGKLDQVDAKELGEVVDMIKDMEEACYYAKIIEAMEKGEEEKKYYTEYYRPYSRDYLRDMDKDYGRMYYGGDWSDAHETSKQMALHIIPSVLILWNYAIDARGVVL